MWGLMPEEEPEEEIVYEAVIFLVGKVDVEELTKALQRRIDEKMAVSYNM